MAVACSKPPLPSIVGKVPAGILRELRSAFVTWFLEFGDRRGYGGIGSSPRSNEDRARPSNLNTFLLNGPFWVLDNSQAGLTRAKLVFPCSPGVDFERISPAQLKRLAQRAQATMHARTVQDDRARYQRGCTQSCPFTEGHAGVRAIEQCTQKSRDAFCAPEGPARLRA